MIEKVGINDIWKNYKEKLTAFNEIKVEKDTGKYSLTKWLSIPVIALIFGTD